MPDFWKVLGIEPTRDTEVVKKAYRDLMKRYHPDRATSVRDNKKANAKCSRINDAFRLALDYCAAARVESTFSQGARSSPRPAHAGPMPAQRGKRTHRGESDADRAVPRPSAVKRTGTPWGVALVHWILAISVFTIVWKWAGERQPARTSPPAAPLQFPPVKLPAERLTESESKEIGERLMRSLPPADRNGSGEHAAPLARDGGPRGDDVHPARQSGGVTQAK